MPIIYSLVSRGINVLSEFTQSGHSGNFSTITRVLLKKIPEEDGKLSYLYDQYSFHYIVSDGLTFLCMSDHEFLRYHAFQFLAEIQSNFLSTYAGRWQTAIAFQFQSDFQHTLSSVMERWNEAKDDKLATIRSDLSAVKDVMIKNIDKVLERGEKIELLVEKSEIMESHAIRFKTEARTLKNRMWWKNIKVWIVLILLLLVIFFVILASACGGPKLPKCS